MNAKLDISIVTYRPNLTLLKEVIKSLYLSIQLAQAAHLVSKYKIFLVDNGDDFTNSWSRAHLHEQLKPISFEILTGHGNIGYGKGNNTAFRYANGDLFLVLNPDVILDRETLSFALRFMNENIDCGLLAPAAFDANGERLALCKRYPSLSTLAIRGFFPQRVRRLFTDKLAKYEMHDLLSQQNVFWEPEIISGCFMLFRNQVFADLGGFNPDYFLYFEDFDLSLRTAEISRIAYVPSVKIVHYGGNASRKSLKHIAMFVHSANTFFSTHGWKWF